MNSKKLNPHYGRIFLCLLALLSCNGVSIAGEPLPWSVPDFPPFHVFAEEGVPPEWIGQGKGDKMLNAYEKAMPEFSFDRIRMNNQRKMAVFNSGANLCAPLQMFTPERNKDFYFVFTNFSGPRQLITTAATAKKLTIQNGSVSLKELIANPLFKGSYIIGRSYGDKLDPLLNAPNPNLIGLTSGNNGKSILRMIALGRSDYTVEYTYSLRFQKDIDKSTKDLVATPITEEGWEIALVGTMCSRNAWGKSIVEKLDNITAALVRTQSYRDLLEENLNEVEKKALREKINAFYVYRGEPGKTNLK